MFIYVLSFFFILFLSPVPMIGAEDAAVEAACKRTGEVRHQDILKDAFVSLLTDNPVDADHGIAYVKSLWRVGFKRVSDLFVKNEAKGSGPSKPIAPDKVAPKKSFLEMVQENIQNFYDVGNPELAEKNRKIAALCVTYADLLQLLQAIEEVSAVLPEDKKENPTFVQIQQYCNYLFEQYRFELYKLIPSLKKITFSCDKSKNEYVQAIDAFFVELSNKRVQLNALHQEVIATEAKYLAIIRNEAIDPKNLQDRMQVCKAALQALQSKAYDSRVQDALKIAILKCDDPALTPVDLLKYEMVIEQQALIPLKPSAHFDRHDAKNIGKLLLVVAVVGTVFFKKYQNDQKVYLDKLRSKIIYAEMPKEKREAFLKKLELRKIKWVPHWIRKRMKYDAFDKKVDVLYQATREKKLKALHVSKSVVITSKA